MAKKQEGMAIFEMILVIAIVAIVAVIGLRVANNRHQVSSQSGTSSINQQQSLGATVSPAPTVKSTADLDKASQTLDSNDPSTGNQLDSSQLDSDGADL